MRIPVLTWSFWDHVVMVIWMIAALNGLGMLGVVEPIVLYGGVGYFIARTAMNFDQVSKALARAPGVYVAVGLAIVSLIWSLNLESSIRGVLLLCFTTLAAVYFAAKFELWKIVVAFGVGSTLILAQNPTAIFEQHQEMYAGSFSHKNFLAMRVMPAGAFGLAIALLWNAPARWTWVRGLGLLLAVGSLLAVLSTKSATSLVAYILATLIILAVWLLKLRPPILRDVVISLGVFGLIAGVFAFTQSVKGDPAVMVLKALGKDSSLTGRTLLWQGGEREIEKRPILGAGYGGFWESRSGHHMRTWFNWPTPEGGLYFHSTYVEYGVAFGYLGGAVLLAAFAMIYTTIIRAVIVHPDWITGFIAALAAVLAARSFVEVDLLRGFEPSTVMMFVAAMSLPGYVRARQAEQRAAKSSAPLGAAPQPA